MLKAVVNWGWCPLLITALVIAGYIFEWEIMALAPALFVILVIGLVVALVNAREKQLEIALLKLRQLGGYFSRRFTGNSSLSIFSLIDSLFSIDNPPLWDWARACDMSARIFNTWCNSFISRLESDVRTRRFDIYLRTYLNELWLMNSHYHEFTEQFYEITQKIEISQEAIDQYNRFVMEYNSFINSFRDTISELRNIARTEVEPPSVKLARELPPVKPPPAKKDSEVKPPKTTHEKGYYM
ncbi:hypothetical protein ACFLVH_05370 [Chloroflexota bacterium]